MRRTKFPPKARSVNSMGKSLKCGLVLVAIVLVFACVSLAKEAQPAENAQIEQRMKSLTEQLRCLVCQNETLADSRADLAEDLRREIRKEIKAGKSDQEIIAFLTQRYGDFILYNPPVKSTTYLLWFGPFVVLLAGIAVLYRYLGMRKKMISDRPLTTAERKQAEELLRSQV
jgi:cytochrome c-type biogenesis protein CcmH